MTELAKAFAKKRPIIETVIGINKQVLNIEHTRHRSIHNAYVHILAALCAYSFCQRKPKVEVKLSQMAIEPPKMELKMAA